MGNRTAKFISAIFASVLAGAPFGAISQTATTAQAAPPAADDCLASPKGVAPQGQHWHYRVERGTKRQCWYLRAEGPKAAQATQQAAQPDAQQSAQPAPAAASAAAPRTVQDARAEWRSQPSASAQASPTPDTRTSPQSVTAPSAAPGVNAAADGDAQAPAVASRWPDASTASPSPAPQPARVAEASPKPQAEASPTPGPMAQAVADAPQGKPAGSLQMLLLVIGGALAVAGTTGSLLYRFSRSRVRVPANERGGRRVNWENWERELEPARAPWLDRSEPVSSPLPRPRPLGDRLARERDSTRHAAASPMVAREVQHEGHEATGESEDAAVLPTTFEIEPVEAHDAPPSALGTASTEETRAETDAIDIDAITAILERLAKEGPRLDEASPAIDPAAFAQSRRDRSDVRA